MQSRRLLALLVAFAALLTIVRAQQVALSSPASWTRDGFQAGAIQSGGLVQNGASLTHTLQIGRTGIDLSLSDDIEYSDNVRVEQTGRPGMSNTFNLAFESMWSPTKLQDIALTGSIGSRVPIFGPGKGRVLWNIAPTTALKANVFIDQLRISPFVRASRSLDPVAATVVSQTETFTQTMNDAGLVADYPLYKANLQFIALAGTKRSAAESAPAMFTQRYSTGLRGVKSFSPGTVVGTDVTAYTQSYDNGPAGKSYGQGFSAFLRVPITKLISSQFSTGWDTQNFSGSKDRTDSKRSSQPFFMASISHRPNADLSYSLMVRQAVFDGVSTNYFQSREITLSPNYSAGKNLSLNASATYKTADESTQAGDHGYTIMGSIGGSYSTRGGTNVSVNYNYVDKTSSVVKREYSQNRFTLSISRSL